VQSENVQFTIAQSGDDASELSSVAADVLAAHNLYREAVGVPPLEWSDTLASSAESWARELAETNTFRHGSSEYGENLWKGTTGHFSPTRMVQAWGDEQRYFIQDAVFPNVSTTGNWQDVGHYTQIVWEDTTDVGCAIATGNGWDVLVCRYSPRGNYIGEQPF
jgi:hypothetical protein